MAALANLNFAIISKHVCTTIPLSYELVLPVCPTPDVLYQFEPLLW